MTEQEDAARRTAGAYLLGDEAPPTPLQQAYAEKLGKWLASRVDWAMEHGTLEDIVGLSQAPASYPLGGEKEE